MNPIWFWQGRSGTYYPHSVFGLSEAVPACSANYIYVRRNRDGTCTALYVGETEDMARRDHEHAGDVRAQALRLGCTEIHVHVLAKTKSHRLDIETDVRHGHPTPLNRQSVLGAGNLIGPVSWTSNSLLQGLLPG